MTNILPETVRYALKHRPRQFGPEEIISLLANNFDTFAFYLTLKGYHENIGKQIDFFSDIANLAASKDTEMLRRKIFEYAAETKPYSIDGAKLAQLSRIGAQYIDEIFDVGFRTIFSRNEVPVMEAYSASVGMLRAFENMKEGNSMIFTSHKYFCCSEILGYEFKHLQKIHVTPLISDTKLNPNLVYSYVDETINSGNTLRSTFSEWDSFSFPRMSAIYYVDCPNGFPGHEGIVPRFLGKL